MRHAWHGRHTHTQCIIMCTLVPRVMKKEEVGGRMQPFQYFPSSGGGGHTTHNPPQRSQIQFSSQPPYELCSSAPVQRVRKFGRPYTLPCMRGVRLHVGPVKEGLVGIRAPTTIEYRRRSGTRRVTISSPLRSVHLSKVQRWKENL